MILNYKFSFNCLRLSPIIAIFTPFLYLEYDKYFNSGYLTSVYIIICAICLTYIPYLWVEKLPRVRISPLDLLVVVFMLYELFNTIAKHENHYASDDILILITGIVLFIVGRMAFEKISDASNKTLIYCIACSALINILVGYLQLFKILESRSGLFKITGIFVNPSIYCSYLSFLFPITLYQTLATKNLVQKCCLSFVCMSIIFFDIVCLCRSALLAVLVTSLVAIYISAPKVKKMMVAYCIAASITCTSIFLICVKPDSAYGRTVIWKISYSMFLDNPVTGIGFGNYKRFYNLYQAQYFKHNQETDKDILIVDDNYYTYNEPFNILIENGIIGMLLFTAIGAIACSRIFVRNKKINFSLFIELTIISICIVGLFSFPFEEPSLYVFFILLFAVYSSISILPAIKVFVPNRRFLHFLSILLLFTGICYIHRLYYTHRWYSLLETPFNGNNDLEKYHAIYPPLKENSFFLTNYAINLQRNDRKLEAARMFQESLILIPSSIQFLRLGQLYYELGLVNKAETNFNMASYITPARFKPKYNLLRLYIDSRQTEKATLMANKILSMPVKISSSEVLFIKNQAHIFLSNPIN